MQMLVSFGLTVTEVCCHKINMNTKEKDIIKRILKCSFPANKGGPSGIENESWNSCSDANFIS